VHALHTCHHFHPLPAHHTRKALHFFFLVLSVPLAPLRFHHCRAAAARCKRCLYHHRAAAASALSSYVTCWRYLPVLRKLACSWTTPLACISPRMVRYSLISINAFLSHLCGTTSSVPPLRSGAAPRTHVPAVGSPLLDSAFFLGSFFTGSVVPSLRTFLHYLLLHAWVGGSDGCLIFFACPCHCHTDSCLPSPFLPAPTCRAFLAGSLLPAPCHCCAPLLPSPAAFTAKTVRHVLCRGCLLCC